MKNLTSVFGIGVVGIVVCLIMTIVTAVQEHQQRQIPPSHSIPAPAIAPN